MLNLPNLLERLLFFPGEISMDNIGSNHLLPQKTNIAPEHGWLEDFSGSDKGGG